MDITHCLASKYDDDGILGIQVDVYAEGGHSDAFRHHISPGGLDHRPVDPDGIKAELCLRIDDGDDEFIFPLNDARTEPALQNLNQGATRLFDTGTFGGFPFHFTALLDPVDRQLVIESHRAGGKILLKNAEELVLEMSGTTLKISGSTSVECGGALALALAQKVDAALTALAGFIKGAAATEANASGLGGMSALALATSAWPGPTVGGQFTKGF